MPEPETTVTSAAAGSAYSFKVHGLTLNESVREHVRATEKKGRCYSFVKALAVYEWVWR